MKSITAFLLFLPLFSFGQKLTLPVTDSLNNEALPFANIYCKFSGIGASTNMEGIATLDLSKMQATDTLVVSYIGYRSQKIFFSKEQKMRSLKIKLKPAHSTLKQVVVTSEKPIKAKKIIKKAIKNTAKNYSNKKSIIPVILRKN